ncbi:MAG: nucleotidyltransferase domain-containing protein [Candidatus Pacebacteria bacterium]|nr:nucleotidyltransferase domain-containing protein [Candidatus Paceibacterota bacterium]
MQKITFTQIKKISNAIVKNYKPEKIILFGSFAWGDPTKDSDVDLLIIKKTKKRFLKRQMEVGRIINGELPTDTLIRTPLELKKRLDLGDFFYKQIIKKGKYLYEKSNK